jgi:CubicO group peptidase (beta-lactamase class C family)
MRTLPFLLLLARCVPAQDIAPQAEQFVQAFVKQNIFQGSVLLARDGKPLFRKSYGLANAEWNIANTPDTKFRLGSITKQFTSALILQLTEQGVVSLDDSIRKYYTEAPPAWQGVTLHHLLSHQSGIPSYTDLPGFFETMATVPRTPAELIRLTDEKPLEFDPGTKYKYDNSGYVLLGYVIEKVSGRKYDEQLRHAILAPLGMSDTGYDSYTAILPHRAEGYVRANGDVRRAAYLDMTLPYAAGSLYSTVDDLLKWDQALYGTAVLSEASKQKMWTPNRSDYGYGWMIEKRFGTAVVGHDGGIPGFNSTIIRLPEKKLVVVVLANANTLSTHSMAEGLLGVALGEHVEPPKPHTKIPVQPEQLRKFEGKYSDASVTLAIRADGDHLTVLAGGPGLSFYAAGPTRFFSDPPGIELDFDADGSALEADLGGNIQHLKRQ